MTNDRLGRPGWSRYLGSIKIGDICTYQVQDLPCFDSRSIAHHSDCTVSAMSLNCACPPYEPPHIPSHLRINHLASIPPHHHASLLLLAQFTLETIPRGFGVDADLFGVIAAKKRKGGGWEGLPVTKEAVWSVWWNWKEMEERRKVGINIGVGWEEVHEHANSEDGRSPVEITMEGTYIDQEPDSTPLEHENATAKEAIGSPNLVSLPFNASITLDPVLSSLPNNRCNSPSPSLTSPPLSPISRIQRRFDKSRRMISPTPQPQPQAVQLTLSARDQLSIGDTRYGFVALKSVNQGPMTTGRLWLGKKHPYGAPLVIGQPLGIQAKGRGSGSGTSSAGTNERQGQIELQLGIGLDIDLDVDEEGCGVSTGPTASQINTNTINLENSTSGVGSHRSAAATQICDVDNPSIATPEVRSTSEPRQEVGVKAGQQDSPGKVKERVEGGEQDDLVSQGQEVYEIRRHDPKGVETGRVSGEVTDHDNDVIVLDDVEDGHDGAAGTIATPMRSSGDTTSDAESHRQTGRQQGDYRGRKRSRVDHIRDGSAQSVSPDIDIDPNLDFKPDYSDSADAYLEHQSPKKKTKREDGGPTPTRAKGEPWTVFQHIAVIDSLITAAKPAGPHWGEIAKQVSRNSPAGVDRTVEVSGCDPVAGQTRIPKRASSEAIAIETPFADHQEDVGGNRISSLDCCNQARKTSRDRRYSSSEQRRRRRHQGVACRRKGGALAGDVEGWGGEGVVGSSYRERQQEWASSERCVCESLTATSRDLPELKLRAELLTGRQENLDGDPQEEIRDEVTSEIGETMKICPNPGISFSRGS